MMSQQAQEQSKPVDPESLDRLTQIAAELNALPKQRSAGRADSFRAVQLYRRAAQLAPEDPPTLVDFMQRYLLRDCVAAGGNDEAGAAQVHRSTLRDILAEWLDALPEPTLWRSRPALITFAINHLLENPSEDWLYVVTTIGYRDESVVDAFKRVASGDDELADTALRLLVGMKVEGADLDWVREQLARRLRSGSPTDEALNAIAMIGDDSAIDVLSSAARDAKHRWFTFSRFGWLCDRAPGDRDWHSRIWDAMVCVADDAPDGWNELLFTGGVIEKCHTPRVIEAIASRLPRLAEEGDRAVDLLGHRVEEMVHPCHVEAVAQVDQTRVSESLRPFAVMSTRSEGRGMTAEAYVKEHAWMLALFFGCEAAMDWADEALSRETNIYQQHHLMEELAVFSLPSLPSVAHSLLTDSRLAFKRNLDQPEVLPFLAAARLAASRLSPKSVRLLMGAAGLIEGSPFRTPVDGAAELAVWLIKQGHDQLLDELTAALASPSLMASCVAARALRLQAAVTGALPNGVANALEHFARDIDRPAYLRADAIDALVAARVASPTFVEALAAWSADGDERLRAAAANAIVEVGALAQYRAAVESFAFRNFDRTTQGKPAPQLTDQESYLIGRLAVADTSSYADAAARIVRSAFSVAAGAALNGVMASSSGQSAGPGKIIDAIISRLQDESSDSSERYLFEALAELDATRLLIEPWEELWDKWMADSRRALVDLLPVAAKKASAVGSRASALAKLLLTDGTFAVRRSAARALSEVDPSALRAQCEQWVGSGSILLRHRAAEASAWVEPDDGRTLDNQLLRKLVADPERRVRNAAGRSRKELHLRLWATEHRRAILATTSDANDWVLRNYARGLALIKSGDDSDLITLAARLRAADAPPNVRQWWERLLKKLERQWRKTTQEWPDPWLPWRGSIEELRGTIATGSSSCAARFSLWAIPPSRGEPLQWGGAAWVEGQGIFAALQISSSTDKDGVILNIEGRQQARAVIASTTGNQLILTGSGGYPKPQGL